MSKNRDQPACSAREVALKALVRFERDQAYLNLVLPSLVRECSEEERSLAKELAAGTVQRLNTLDWALQLYLKQPLKKLTPWIRNLLRLSAYQLLYLDRVPQYAAVDQAVHLAGRYGHRGVAGLVNAVLRRLSREAAVLPWPDRQQQPIEYLCLKESYPRWLVKRVLKRWEFNEVEAWCRANNRKPALSIRPNNVQTSENDLVALLAEESVEAVKSPVVPGMLRIRGGMNPARTESFREGLFSIQGESSSLVAPLLEPQSHDRIVDLCSAPGGKTTHLAELMNDRGLIYAVDLHKKRLQLVERAARRLRLQSIRTLEADGRMIGTLDLSVPSAVLVDAPCTGLGVIRRLPEIKWRRTAGDPFRMQQLQLQLLNAAADILPVGGKLLYSVCSSEPEECSKVTEIFSTDHPHFRHEECVPRLPSVLQKKQDNFYTVSLLPHHHGTDGFYMALWTRKG
ncbi:MAG: 16S rRNA (cytosine(967)-C(5))-methyltransferase RsmB [Bacillota bacterium]|nr:16S rRNA (cytosine(967)-C(5))-methyltransferase RsmB [Bacillota bacterium]